MSRASGSSPIRLSLLAVAALTIALVSALAISQVRAQDEELRLASATVQTGQQVKIDLEARNMNFPGLGAWTVDIIYNPSVVTPLTCVPQNGGVCNPNFAVNAIRIVGARSTGLQGNNTLVNMTFRCANQGSTTLAMQIRDLADASTGNPQPIAATAQNGQITCATPGGLPGDVNCDGIVNSIDAALVLQQEAGLLGSVPCPQNADLNHDGRINSVDAAIILQMVAGLL